MALIGRSGLSSSSASSAWFCVRSRELSTALPKQLRCIARRDRWSSHAPQFHLAKGETTAPAVVLRFSWFVWSEFQLWVGVLAGARAGWRMEGWPPPSAAGRVASGHLSYTAPAVLRSSWSVWSELQLWTGVLAGARAGWRMGGGRQEGMLGRVASAGPD
jgi:hypothetical protein